MRYVRLAAVLAFGISALVQQAAMAGQSSSSKPVYPDGCWTPRGTPPFNCGTIPTKPANVVVRDHRTQGSGVVFPSRPSPYKPPVYSKDSSSAPGGVIVTPTSKPIIRDHRRAY